MIAAAGGGGGGRSFPALGFDPAPGELGEVEALVGDLNSAVTSLGESAGLLGNLSSKTGSDWRGKAADAYREHANTDLTKALRNAHDSFAKAHKAMQGWSADLSEYQRQADTLERQAEQAKADVTSAENHLTDVNANPYHVTGSDPTGELATRAHHLQQQAVSDANGAVSTAKGSLDDILKRARSRQGEHDHAAGSTAKSLDDAPDNLAPSKPGFFSSIGHWISDHASDIAGVLDDISAVAGIVALVTPPPIDAIALGVAVGCSLGAAGLHAYKGEWGKMGVSLVGAVPGIGAVGDVAKGARAAETIADGVKFARGAESAGDAAFGARYAISGVGDAMRAAPRLAKDGLDSLQETKVFGSHLSRAAVSGISKLPGVTVHDGLGLAANIEKGVAGAGGVMGGADLIYKGVNGLDTTAPGTDQVAYGEGGYGFGNGALDVANHLPRVRVP